MFSYETVINGHDLSDMALGFAEGRDASVARNGSWTGVVCGQRQLLGPELIEHKKQVASRTIEVLMNVMGIDAEFGSCGGHKLAQTDSPNMTARARIVGALNLDIGPVKALPLRD